MYIGYAYGDRPGWNSGYRWKSQMEFFKVETQVWDENTLLGQVKIR